MDIEKIINQYNNGKAFTKLAKENKCSPSKIRRILTDNNVSIRNLSESHEIYNFDKNYFKAIDSQDKAYFLGFLYADGNVCKNVMQICLHEKDVEILYNMKLYMKSNHPIVDDRGYKRFRIGNVNLISQLYKLGVRPKKTFNLQFPSESILPKKYVNDFIRGFFDGDGTIGKYNEIWTVRFYGIETFLKKIQEQFKILADVEFKIYKHKNIRTLSKGGCSKNSLDKIYNFLYPNVSSVSLSRKRNKFIDILK